MLNNHTHTNFVFKYASESCSQLQTNIFGVNVRNCMFNVMFCYFQQVEATQQNLEPPSEQQPPRRGDGLNNDLAKHLSSLAFKLALTEDEHSVRKQ